jgi:SAM-dependent MidA family methyltransferase
MTDDTVARRPSVEIGVRRVHELDHDAPLPDGDPLLVDRIAAEIRASGPMTFARFMELALYDPEAGYYAATGPASQGTTGPGRAGDFLTAPESHPIFGWAMSRHLESVWAALDRPSPFVVREHGAGTGAFAAGILDGVRRSGSDLLEAIRYQAIDAAPARVEALRERLAVLGLAERLEPPDDRPEAGAILANELLDALPVHRVEGGADGAVLERFVDLDGATLGRPFTTVLGPPSTPALAARLAAEGVRLQPGQAGEVCLDIDRWIVKVTTPLARGELLLIDYGYPADELYRPERGSTLRAYQRHRVHADPLVAIGRQDLTAHVDLTAVERATAAAGLEPIGQTRQADFLAALDAGELLVGLQSDPAIDLAAYLDARASLIRMLDPRVTGGFAVLAFGRGIPADRPLRGFPGTA